jgi:hypothetical protein
LHRRNDGEEAGEGYVKCRGRKRKLEHDKELGLPMTDKPVFQVDLAKNAQSGLEAQPLLEMVDNAATYHTAHNLRPALGIYNVSTFRTLKKAKDLCEKLEDYIRLDPDSPDHEFISRAQQALIDYIELSLYAAAEHVDDLEHIVKHFYQFDRERVSCTAYKNFQKEVKQHKRFISAVTNYIKHSQHRIRLYHLNYVHENHADTFHGYIIESVTDGVVGPSPVFHSTDRNVFSTTSLAWEIIMFVLRSSRSLKTFLSTKKLLPGSALTSSEHLTEAMIAAARLPLYNLDDDHPFSIASLKLMWDELSNDRASSLLYGSISNQWHSSNALTFGKSGVAFAGDGITRSFKMLIKPSRVGLQHWK